MLIKLLPIILPIILAVITFKFSANRTVQNLKKSSTEVTEPQLTSLIQKMAKELNLNRIQVYVYKIKQIKIKLK